MPKVTAFRSDKDYEVFLKSLLLESIMPATSSPAVWATVVSLVVAFGSPFVVWDHGFAQGEKNAKAEVAAKMSKLEAEAENTQKRNEILSANLKAWQESHAKLLAENAALNNQLQVANTNSYLQSRIDQFAGEIKSWRVAGAKDTDPQIQSLEERIKAFALKLECRI